MRLRTNDQTTLAAIPRALPLPKSKPKVTMLGSPCAAVALTLCVREMMQESLRKPDLMMHPANLRTRALSGGPRHIDSSSRRH